MARPARRPRLTDRSDARAARGRGGPPRSRSAGSSVAPSRDVEVLHPRAVRRHVAGCRGLRRPAGRPAHAGVPTGAASTCGCRSTSGEALVAHLGMSGQLLVQPSGGAGRDAPAGPAGASPTTAPSCGSSTSARSAGSPSSRGRRRPACPTPVAHIARDPLDPEFDDAAFAAALRRRRTGVKRALLDQTLVSGIGNIYADEALWRSRLHYARPTETLRRTEVDRLLGHVREVMDEALAAGRHVASTALYVNVNGDAAATSTGRWTSTGRRAARARAAAPRSAGTRS